MQKTKLQKSLNILTHNLGYESIEELKTIALGDLYDSLTRRYNRDMEDSVYLCDETFTETIKVLEHKINYIFLDYWDVTHLLQRITDAEVGIKILRKTVENLKIILVQRQKHGMNIIPFGNWIQERLDFSEGEDEIWFDGFNISKSKNPELIDSLEDFLDGLKKMWYIVEEPMHHIYFLPGGGGGLQSIEDTFSYLKEEAPDKLKKYVIDSMLETKMRDIVPFIHSEVESFLLSNFKYLSIELERRIDQFKNIKDFKEKPAIFKYDKGGIKTSVGDFRSLIFILDLSKSLGIVYVNRLERKIKKFNIKREFVYKN